MSVCAGDNPGAKAVDKLWYNFYILVHSIYEVRCYRSNFVYCRVNALLILDWTLKYVDYLVTEKVGSFRLGYHTFIYHHSWELQYATVVQWFKWQYQKLKVRGHWFETCVLCYFLFFFIYFIITFRFYFIPFNYYYYNYFFSLCILIMIFPLLVRGVRVGRLCWVGQQPAVLAAAGWWRLFVIISRVIVNWLAIIRP